MSCTEREDPNLAVRGPLLTLNIIAIAVPLREVQSEWSYDWELDDPKFETRWK
jgi:hypothetical protein